MYANCKGIFGFLIRGIGAKMMLAFEGGLKCYFQCRLVILPESQNSFSAGCCDTCWQKRAD